MSAAERMTIDERLKYLRVMTRRYMKASREEKAGLLDKMAMVTAYSRKHLIHLLGGDLSRPPRQGGRQSDPQNDSQSGRAADDRQGIRHEDCRQGRGALLG